MSDEDLISTIEAAQLLGFKHDGSMHHYVRTRANFPRPVKKIRVGRTLKLLWSRREVLAWNVTRDNTLRVAEERSYRESLSTLAIQFITGKFRPEDTQ